MCMLTNALLLRAGSTALQRRYTMMRALQALLTYALHVLQLYIAAAAKLAHQALLTLGEYVHQEQHRRSVLQNLSKGN
jgi:hypothetical protein